MADPVYGEFVTLRGLISLAGLQRGQLKTVVWNKQNEQLVALGYAEIYTGTGAPPPPLDPYATREWVQSQLADVEVSDADLAATVAAASATRTAVDARVRAVGDATYGRAVKWTNAETFRVTSRGSAYAIGFDEVDGLGYFATTNLFTSTDNVSLTQRAMPTGVSTGANIGKVVRFGAHVYCLAKMDDNKNRIYRSTPPGADLSWTQVHETATSVGGVIGTAFNKSTWASNNYLYFVEYGDPASGPTAWRSADGATWQAVLGPVSGLRHFHAIAADPYRDGHVYLTAGDGQGKSLYRSTDRGATWTLLITDSGFQGVQISFSPDWVYVAGDSGRVTVWVIDRDNPTSPMIASSNHHALTPVPGGLPGRGVFTDAALTSGSAVLTSNTAAFTASDVGKLVRFVNVYAPIDATNGIWVQSYQSATQVTLNKAATGTASNRQFYVDGDSYYRNAFYGVVDPATGIYYCISNDSSSGGTRSGLFALSHVGGRLELIENLPTQTPGELFIWNGSIWCHQARHPLTNRV